jgi:Nitrogen regulatory protein PII
MMKMIMAVIRPEKLKNVKDALKEAGINGMTMYPVRGRGSQSGVTFTTRTGTFCVDEIEKMMLNIVVEDDQKELAINVIKNTASTDHIGDGRIFVLPVEESYKVCDD